MLDIKGLIFPNCLRLCSSVKQRDTFIWLHCKQIHWLQFFEWQLQRRVCCPPSSGHTFDVLKCHLVLCSLLFFSSTACALRSRCRWPSRPASWPKTATWRSGLNGQLAPRSATTPTGPRGSALAPEKWASFQLVEEKVVQSWRRRSPAARRVTECHRALCKCWMDEDKEGNWNKYDIFDARKPIKYRMQWVWLNDHHELKEILTINNQGIALLLLWTNNF